MKFTSVLIKLKPLNNFNDVFYFAFFGWKIKELLEAADI